MARRATIKRGRGTHKTPVDAETGECRSQAVANVSGKTLRKMIVDNVDTMTAMLHTDALPAYLGIGSQMAGHFSVDHEAGEYVTEKSTGTQMAENFFSQLKRSFDGTFHHVSKEHLHRYLGEFDFRFSTCDLTDSDRMALLMDRTDGRRLTYKKVTG